MRSKRGKLNPHKYLTPASNKSGGKSIYGPGNRRFLNHVGRKCIERVEFVYSIAADENYVSNPLNSVSIACGRFK